MPDLDVMTGQQSSPAVSPPAGTGTGKPLSVRGLRKTYGGVTAVDEVSMEIAAGEFVTFLGSSGSGKTTTLMMIAGFTEPDGGTIMVGDREVTRLAPQKRGLGFVFQQYLLFPHMTVGENIAFPLQLRGVPRAEIRRRVGETLEMAGLSGLARRRPRELSGGQQQRVALCRALVLAPLVIPQVVIALGLFLLFEPASMLGSPVAIALGHTVLASPIAVMILMATLKGIDERLEDAAASMGASRLTIARRITLPLATPGMVAAAIFSFITSFDEFFISQFLSSVDTVTLPVQVFNVLQYDVDPSVTAISAVLIAVALLALALVGVVRRLGSGKQSGLLPVESAAGLPAGKETS